MRLWTLHPKYLDAKGLVALWREGLLAQKVLRGATKGYHHHPQLIRFKSQHAPVAALASYLRAVHEEAVRRGYRFNAAKIFRQNFRSRISETKGQLHYEWLHLERKLRKRAPELLAKDRHIAAPEAHPLFGMIEGPRREWEIVTPERKSTT